MTAVTKDPRDILIAPVVSEKSYGLLDEGKYTFIVDPRANKTEIKIAIEQAVALLRDDRRDQDVARVLGHGGHFVPSSVSAASDSVATAVTERPVTGPARNASSAPCVKTTSSEMSTS